MNIPSIKHDENNVPYLSGNFEFVFGNDVTTNPETQEQSIDIDFKLSTEIQQNVNTYSDYIFEIIGEALKQEFINKLKSFKTNG